MCVLWGPVPAQFLRWLAADGSVVPLMPDLLIAPWELVCGIGARKLVVENDIEK